MGAFGSSDRLCIDGAWRWYIPVGSVNLTKWTVYMPCRGQYAASKQRRIQRWLHNPRINVHRLYGSLIKADAGQLASTGDLSGIRHLPILG
ncbi:MAG: hypothetical protein F6J98_08850 [Moorea sp. SIO4G2]|uniref:hypothetical protein n=1 Tax=unclassified Moorena TaxID=2683338 RepID=UPI0013FB884E|nr:MULTISPECIES: hypothetical protein [unclassified Moorena]NEO15490.1 hypothetical protein [Moorena sp. SIO3E8]NEO60530.1 hypothetical protein [Moorena sp. SIO4G2]NEP98483.1 hypothetical protein [Moorena sp. SIO3F7]